MDLSVVIINWNSGAYLARLLKSLQELTPECERILVLDNASSDSSATSLRLAAPMEVDLLERNLGFAGAANYGMRKTDSEFVLLLNPDIEANAESVRNLYQAIRNNGKTAIACGALKSGDGSSQQSFQLRSLPTLWSALRDVLFLDELIDLVLRRNRMSPQVPESGWTGESGLLVDQPAAAFWLLRRSSWQAVGGFDEAFYPAWFEDVDFCKRLREADWEIRYFPQYSVTHRGGLSLETLPYPEFVDVFYGNLLKYWRKHHRMTYPLLVLPVKLGVWVRRRFVAP